jgi:tRNA A-37 threonylcarbamoyl transferase component Bud32
MPDKNRPAASPPERLDRLAGKTIANRYVIERLIARGGMAAVYLAHQVQLNRKVAIKILRPPPDTDESAGFVGRFRLEAETLAQLNHPHIVTIYDHGEFDHDQVFLTMEYVDGQRLTDVIRDGAIPVDRTVRLLLQVCEALRYAHRRGVIHRDLKPSNLLIARTDDGDEHVKVVDFGLVKLTEVDMSVTSAGLILGSPHCMAPEQVRGLAVDPRTDVYAVGVLLFRCLTGRYPFHGANSTATMIAHLNQPIPTFASVAPGLAVPEGLEAVVRRCLAKKPADRFASMDELQEYLTVFLSTTEAFRTVSRSQASLVGFSGTPEPAPRRVPVGVVLGALGVVALLSLGVCAGVWATVGLSGTPEASGPSAASGTPGEEAPVDAPAVQPPASEDVGLNGASGGDPGAVPPDGPPAADTTGPAAGGTERGESRTSSRTSSSGRRGGSGSRADAGSKPTDAPQEKPEAPADPQPKPEKVDIGKELAPDFDAW